MGVLPIRKIAPDRVALTSYYGKTFVFRSEKKVNNYGWWLQNKITEIGLDTNDIRVVDLYPANVFDNEFKSPRLYSTLAMMFNGFTVNYQSKELPDVTETFVLSFDHTKRNELFGEDTVKLYETDGSIVVGYDKVKSYLIVDKNDQLYIGKNGNLTYLGSIEEFIGIDKVTPIDFAELKVMSKSVPVGIVLAYEVGLTKLINHFNIKTRIHHVGTGRVSMDPSSEFSIHFSDAILIFSKEDPLTRMIFAGFNEYWKTIKEFSIYEFDRKSVYFNVLESNGISVRYLREIDLMNQMFVDPITRDLLIEMKEPTDFRGLLIRSAQMLLNDQHPKEFDGAFMRIKGYERFAGAVYNELVETLRGHNARTGKANLALDFNPNAVWNKITQDRAVTLTSEINPIQYLKEVEATTYNGTGGRSAISMTKNSRVYHENDMGTISEATVDSSDVALNVYAPANPLFTSVRGISKRYDKEKINPTSLLSTSALISVAADRDDPKRVNFISIQHSHAIACDAYRALPLRTGYERVMAHRMSDLFAQTAKKDGKVVSVSSTGMVVEYKDGSKDSFVLGRRYGNSAGLTIPHLLTTSLKEGDKFKFGDTLCYNPGFFEKDIFDPSQVLWKSGILVKVALMESSDTLEDSSVISRKIANETATSITKVKNVIINFDQSPRKVVKVGAEVKSDDILCIIENAITADTGLFDEDTIDTLKVLSAQTPTAKMNGVVERIEVLYHGEKEDMSETLLTLVNQSDKDFAVRAKSISQKTHTGEVDETYRIEGNPLSLNTACIRFYITGTVGMAPGDKGVFSNQLKTVIGRVEDNPILTESGVEIDAIFGSTSVYDRIVNSAFINGTTNTLLKVISQKAAKLYFSS